MSEMFHLNYILYKLHYNFELRTEYTLHIASLQAKMQKDDFFLPYHSQWVTVILQNGCDKSTARNGDTYEDDSGILFFVIRCFGISYRL